MSLPIHSYPSAYRVSCIRQSHPESNLFTLSVELTGVDRWAIRWHGQVYNHEKREWSYEPLSSGRTPTWLRKHRYNTLEEALSDAQRLAPNLTVNGTTPEKFLAFYADQESSS